MKQASPGGTTVGFIGLGRLGSLMAKNVVNQGFPLIVWNRTTEKTKEFLSLGARVAPDPKALADRSDVIISNLSTPSVTGAVILGADGLGGRAVVDGLSSGKILIDMSTSLPSEIRRICAATDSKGAKLVDAPVVGSLPLAANRTLTILASGEKSVVDYVMPVFEAMGKKIWYMGGLGSATVMKLALNLHLFVITGAFSESVALAIKMGLDPELVMEVWNSTVQKTYVSETKANKILDRDFVPNFTVELALKDLNLASDMAKEANAALPIGNLVRDLYTAALTMDLKDLDYSAISSLYERLLNITLSRSKNP